MSAWIAAAALLLNVATIAYLWHRFHKVPLTRVLIGEIVSLQMNMDQSGRTASIEMVDLSRRLLKNKVRS